MVDEKEERPMKTEDLTMVDENDTLAKSAGTDLASPPRMVTGPSRNRCAK